MKRFWKAAAEAAAYFAVFLGIQIWVSLAAMFAMLLKISFGTPGVSVFSDPGTFANLYLEGMTRNLTVVVLWANVLTVLAFWLFFRIRHAGFSRRVGLCRTKASNLLLSVLFGFGLCFSVDLVTVLLPVPEAAMDSFAAEHSLLWMGKPWLTFLSVVLVGPVSEEICFRGLCYTSLKKGMRPLWAGLLSAVLFGLAHGNPVWFLVGFAAGLGMAWIFERTGSLWTSILVHMTNNAISQFTAGLELSAPVRVLLTVLGLMALGLSGYLLIRTNPGPAPADAC